MRQAWEHVRLSELCDFQNGFTFKNTDYVDEDDGTFQVFRMGNILRGGGLNPQANKALISREQGEKLRRFLLNEGDILMCMTDMKASMALLGHTAWMPVSGRYLLNQRVGRITVRQPDRLDSRFLYYYSNSPEYIAWLRAHANSGVQVNLSTEVIRNSPVVCPPLPVQLRIAGILSAYDDLIENHTRRIKILEEMAHTLFREWFIQFRFPGHEQFSRVASPFGDIPQGWEVKQLHEVCDSVQDGDWIETKDQGGNRYRLLQISNVGVGEFIETGNFRFVTQTTFERLRCTEIKPNDILVARMPTPIGRAWLVTPMPWRMVTAVDVAIIRTQPNMVHPLFLAQTWNEPFNLRRIAAQASGTTRLRITRRELAGLRFIVPPIELQLRFANFIEPQVKMVQALQQKVQNLRGTRDLLLPKLISGRIDFWV